MVAWTVVGGFGPEGGVVVRTGQEMTSALYRELLATGAQVEEIELVGDRLHFKKLDGSGPEEGWVSRRFRGKDLLVPRRPPRSPAPEFVGPDQQPPLPAVLLFPGQGSQYVMMMDGVQAIPAVKEMLSKAKKILGYDLLELCQEGPEERLEETRFCQPAMFVAGLAGLEKLRLEKEEVVCRAASLAGFSLGEYTALCAAGVLDFEDALRLVQLRGEAMQDAAAIGKQRMLSLVGLPRSKVDQLCAEAVKKAGPDSVCQVAICLFPDGFSIGGTETAINILKELAEKAGAAQAKVLKTSGGFHTPLMQPALDRLSAVLEDMLPRMRSPLHTVWMNASAGPMRPGCDPSDIVELLKQQLTMPVLWEDSIREMLDEGMCDFYELGPQRQLKAMMKRIDNEVWKNMCSVEIGERTRAPPPAIVGPKSEAPMHVALLFPGQGSQYVGMLQAVRELPAVRAMAETAKRVMGYDLLELCCHGPDELIHQTNVTQPAMFLAGMAGLEKLRAQSPEVVHRAHSMLGLSIGEYVALCGAGVFSFEDGLYVIKQRSQAMQEATEAAKQVMLSVVGLDDRKLEQLCKEVTDKQGAGAVCQIALRLFPGGISVGGNLEAVLALKAEAERVGAAQAKILGENAFHTPLMQRAVPQLAAALEEIRPRMKSPLHSVWMNASGEPLRPGCDPQEIIDLLKRQMTRPVLWEASLKELLKEGISKFYEIGPNKTLKGMLKRVDAAAWKTMENIEV